MDKLVFDIGPLTSRSPSSVQKGYNRGEAVRVDLAFRCHSQDLMVFPIFLYLEAQCLEGSTLSFQ